MFGKDDPIMLVRTQKNFPATEEVGSMFNNPHYVAGKHKRQSQYAINASEIKTLQHQSISAFQL